MSSESNDQQNRGPLDNLPKGNIWTALIITLALVLLAGWVFNQVSDSQYTETTFSEFLEAKEAEELAEVELCYDRVIYLTKEEAAKDPARQRACYSGLPSGGDKLALAEELERDGVVVTVPITEDNSVIMMILSYAITFAILFVFMRMLTKRMGGDGMMGGFGKSKAKA